MKFSEIEETLSSYGSGGYALLESFILRLLQVEAEHHGQSLRLESLRGPGYFDAFAPRGLGDIEKPVFIEIENVLTPGALADLVRRHAKYRSSADEVLLIVSKCHLGQKTDLTQKILQEHDGEVFVWEEREIQELMDKHPQEVANAINQRFSIHVNQAMTRPADWIRRREDALSQITEAYESGRFSMWLGAGVSSSAGLPDWNTLLNSLFVSIVLADGRLDSASADDKAGNSIVKRLRELDGPSALTLARYIRRGLSSNTASEQEQEKFISMVTSKLYSLRNKNFSTESNLIKAITSLCVPARTGAKVKALVTYNFDDLIERSLRERGLANRSIFEEIDIPNPEELPVFHVHGFLPENRSGYLNLNKSTLVFSEEGYHRIYGEPYHWSNLTQLTYLKESTCLMIGLSLTDPNLRRLLEISSQYRQGPRHFAFLRRTKFESFMFDEKNGKRNKVVRSGVSTVRQFLEKHHNLHEEVLRELGVTVIWYEEHDQLPGLLKKIGQAAI